MKINGVSYRTIWVGEDGRSVWVIDQTRLPFELVTCRLDTVEDAARAISDMQVRGAPLIGVTAAYGLCLALAQSSTQQSLERASATLQATRPTAVNLRWALEELRRALDGVEHQQWAEAAYRRAAAMADEDVETCRRIGEHGAVVLCEIAATKAGAPVNVLTHCNAGWLATVDWGTALAPVYVAHDDGVPVHVWVDETRPRNQGASLTAFELANHGVPHTVVVDNVGGHLMQHGMVDVCIVGSDRTTGSGDVANKIGTYLKALAARDNGIPFYVAIPGSTIDWTLTDGVAEIPIEQRSPEEVTRVSGRTCSGEVISVEVVANGSQAANYAFDVTPARLVTGLITERGVCPASRAGLTALYPEHD